MPTEEHDTLHATLLDGVSWMLALRRPSLSAVERTLIAEMSFAMFKAALDLVVQSEGEKRTAYAGEMKSMLYRYLAPSIGTGPVAIGETETAAAHSAVVAAAAADTAAAQRAKRPGAGGAAATGATSRALPKSS